MNLNVIIVDNKMDTTSTTNTPAPPSTSTEQAPPDRVRIVDVEIGDANGAFNLMIQFLSLAQSRGAFKIDESAKIFECLKMFNRSDAPTESS